MIQDLAQYDLLQLIAGESWPEQEQAETVVNFCRALSGFMGEKLNPYFKQGDDKEFQQMLQNENLTEKDIMNFYESKIPNPEETMGSIALEFKKMFLLMVYENKIKELESKIPSIQDEDIKRMETNTLESWKQILELAKQDDWDKAQQVLSVIPR